MPITYKTGNLLNDDALCLVNAVNCRGAMGAGIAAQFKIHYPAMFLAYKQSCLRRELKKGKIFLYLPDGQYRIILCFPTKDDWRDGSDISYLHEGLPGLVEIISRYDITSIALPALGCGLGGLSWVSVMPVMERYLEHLEIDVRIYPPRHIMERVS